MRRVTVKASGCVGSSSSLMLGGNCNVSTTNTSSPDQGGGRREFHSTPVVLSGRKVGAAPSSTTATRAMKKGSSSSVDDSNKRDGSSVEIGEGDTTKKKKIGKKKRKEDGESGEVKKGGGDDEFDIDRIMATLFKASSSPKDGGVPPSSSEVLNLDAFLQNSSELERAGNSSVQAGSETAAADEETEFDSMEKMMRELNFENARKINGAHLLQYIPNETESGAPAEPPFPVMELLVHSEGSGPSRQACLPLQILEPHSTETLKKKRANSNSKRSTTTITPPSAQIDSYVSPVNVMPTTENFSPLPDAAAVENDMLHPSVSSLPMEYFNEPCFQSYLQRFVYPHLNGFSKATKAGYLKGTINPVDVALMEHRKNNAEVPARLCRDRFPYTANMNTTTTSKNIPRSRRQQRGSAAQDEDSVDGNSVAIAPQPPGSISLLPSTMIHSTVDWSIPIFHRLQNTILYSEHLRGSSPHIFPSALPESPSFSSTSGLSLMVEKEASLLNQAFLDLVDLAKSVWSEADMKTVWAKKSGANASTIPSVLDEAIYEFVIRLYYGSVAPARIGALNTEFVDPRAQKRQRLLSPLEACRLLVEPQDLPSSVFNELDELEIANYNSSTSLESSVSPSAPPPPHYPLRHRDPHDVTTSFTLVRERVVIEPEVEGVTSVDHAISHVRRMAQVSAREDEEALRADNVFSSPPPEEVRGEDGRLTNDYLQRYTKWHEEQAEMMKVSEEERTKILADTEAVEAMRELLKVRQLERLREKTKALGAKSKRQQAELKAIYKLSPEEVLAKYGTLFPSGSTPVVLRKYELLFGKKLPEVDNSDSTENTNSTKKPAILSHSSVIPTATNGDQASDVKTDTTSGVTDADTTASQQHHTGSDVRTKTTREGIYAFFYSTQPELKSNGWDVARPAHEARLVASIRASVIDSIREAVTSWRAQGEMPWESSNPTLLGARNPEMLVSPMVAASSAESSSSTLSSTGERGYGDVPYMSDEETTRAESAASGLPAKFQSTSASSPTYAQYPALSHLVSNLAPDHFKGVIPTIPIPSSFTMPHLKEATEIVGRLKGFDWKSKAGRLVSKDGDVIHQSPVGQHRAYLTFCAAATFSNAGQSTHDGVCLSITDPYCHGCQRAVTPAETTGPAVSGPTGRIIEDKVWVPEHCSLDKAIAEDFKASAQERDSQRPLPPAFRK